VEHAPDGRESAACRRHHLAPGAPTAPSLPSLRCVRV
jgi:hypothetical protein